MARTEKNPKHGSVDEDITDEDEECDLIGTSDAAKHNPNTSGSSQGDSFVGLRTTVTPRAEALLGHHSDPLGESIEGNPNTSDSSQGDSLDEALLGHHSDPLDENTEGTCQGTNVDENRKGNLKRHCIISCLWKDDTPLRYLLFWNCRLAPFNWKVFCRYKEDCERCDGPRCIEFCS
jgi:hypothetical protein